VAVVTSSPFSLIVPSWSALSPANTNIPPD
jgi:hypothetical protein